MSNGSPDYTRKVKLYAMYNDTLVPVTVDGEGRIIMIPYGTLEVEGDVNVTQTDSVREIQGKDGVTLRTIAVDSTGRIIGVFKGQYGEELKTVKVDDEGRIIALLTDELDIYNNKVIVGNAELAARLGSEKFFDRRGDVFFIDNFSYGNGHYQLYGYGTGNAQEISTEKFRSKGYSLKLVGGSDGDLSAFMTVDFPYPVLSKWGFEISFLMNSNIDALYFFFEKFTGSQKLQGAIGYDHTNSKLQYIDSEGNYQDIIPSFKLSYHQYRFNVIKLVLDLVNDKYHRLILNETEYDLSAYDLYPSYSPTRKTLGIAIALLSRSGYNDTVYFDNLIITQNEPD